MPVSEDEFERPSQMAFTHPAMLSKAEKRKNNKPFMEKRRRARINHCLNELKTLILDAMKKDPARHSKLEKADILEMTVKHLQQMQRQQLATAVATDPSVLMRFKNGFDECAAEVNRYISRLEGVDNGIKQRLAAHLRRCMCSIQQMSTLPHQSIYSGPNQNCDKTSSMLPNVPVIPGDVNNNCNQIGRIQIHGLRLIPSRLSTGELALLVPNSNHLTTFVNDTSGSTFQLPHNSSVTMNSVLSPTFTGSLNSNINRISAFTVVSKNQDYPSPTSTADVVKKEPNVQEQDECKRSSYTNGACLDQSTHLQNYRINDYKMTESKNEDEKYKFNLLPSDSDLTDKSLKTGMFKDFKFKSDEVGDEQKVFQRASSSSFQRTVADSTTSFLQSKEPESSGFKPFQVEIPNSHLKAHISISENLEVKTSSFPILQKPNPNFTLNPNRPYQKSPQKFSRNLNNSENNFSETGLEKFLKIEPLNGEHSENSQSFSRLENSTVLLKPSSSETFQNIEGIIKKSSQGCMKRPLSNESPESAFPSSSESPSKTFRIPLRVTSTDGQSEDEQNSENRCKRISVIVEDSSKSNERENNSEVTLNMSSQKDMWRPW